MKEVHSAMLTPSWTQYVIFSVTLISLVVILYWMRGWIRIVRFALTLPGPPALPILGNIFLVKNSADFVKFADTVYEKYGSLFRGWLTVVPIIIIVEPKHIQLLLSSNKHTEKNFLYSFMHTFIGSGLITNSGHQWKLHRRYIQPYFHINNLSIFLSVFGEASQKMVNSIKKQKYVKITNVINECILDILYLAILGVPLEDNVIKNDSPIRSGTMMLIQRVLKPWLLLNSTYKLTGHSKEEIKQKYNMHDFIKKILDQRKLIREQKGTLRPCLLDMFLEIAENNEDFTEEDIINEACTFVLAGQDSVGAAIVFTLYYLAKHQNILNKVNEEIDTLNIRCDNIEVDVLNKMKYLEQCIMEAMRLHPSVPLFARKISDDLVLDNYVIPAGTNIFISPYVTHRLSAYYPNPEQFIPERFSSNTKKFTNNFAYIPFSAGPRNCIGYKFAMLEMKTIISILLKNFKITLDPNYTLEVYYRVTLRIKGGLTLYLSQR